MAASRGDTGIEYKIPPLVPGRPPYEILHAIRYNRDKLRNAGFVVEIAEDVLLVNWKPRPREHRILKPKPVPDPKTKTEPDPKPEKPSNNPSLSSINAKLSALGKKFGKQW